METNKQSYSIESLVEHLKEVIQEILNENSKVENKIFNENDKVALKICYLTERLATHGLFVNRGVFSKITVWDYFVNLKESLPGKETQALIELTNSLTKNPWG